MNSLDKYIFYYEELRFELYTRYDVGDNHFYWLDRKNKIVSDREKWQLESDYDKLNR